MTAGATTPAQVEKLHALKAGKVEFHFKRVDKKEQHG